MYVHIYPFFPWRSYNSQTWWVTVFGALCCFHVFVACECTLLREQHVRLPWEDFLICGLWPACHLLQAIHELSVPAVSAKHLMLKKKKKKVWTPVQNGVNLGVFFSARLHDSSIGLFFFNHFFLNVLSEITKLRFSPFFLSLFEFNNFRCNEVVRLAGWLACLIAALINI